MEKQIIAWFDLLGGLPLHPMIVHVLVAGTPLIAALAMFAAATGRRNRWLQLSVAAFLNLLIAVAVKFSGEALASRVGYEKITATNHVLFANLAVIAAAALFCALLIMNAVDRRRRLKFFWSRGAALFVLWLVGIASILVTIYAAHTGGAAVWQDTKQQTAYGTHAEP